MKRQPVYEPASHAAHHLVEAMQRDREGKVIQGFYGSGWTMDGLREDFGSSPPRPCAGRCKALMLAADGTWTPCGRPCQALRDIHRCSARRVRLAVWWFVLSTIVEPALCGIAAARCTLHTVGCLCIVACIPEGNTH